MKAADIAPNYVPTTKYDDYSCTQLGSEFRATTATIHDVSGKLERGEYDKSGSLIVTPFFLMYDNTTARDETPKKAQELARLKGIRMSIEEAANRTHCIIQG